MNNIIFTPISVGFVSVGALAIGIIAIGACSVGIVAVGASSVGIFAFGGNAFGIIAIGAGTRYGWINPKSTPRGRFDIGKVAGIVAVGPAAYGLYTLSYAGKSRYYVFARPSGYKGGRVVYTLVTEIREKLFRLILDESGMHNYLRSVIFGKIL